MRHLIAFFVLLLLLVSCGSDARAPEPQQATVSSSLQTAGDRGISVMLPFPAGQTRIITRSYDTAPTHLRHGAMEWDDSRAVDLAGESCGSAWGTPVLAAAAGTVIDYPLPGSSALRDHLDASYGDQQVFIDHGNGCYSHYGHLERRDVVAGQRVQQGEPIGIVGKRGDVQSSCIDPAGHAGAHLHFKMFCGGDAIVPEPLSGYRDLGDKAGYQLSHRALHHPVGTLVKSAGAPDIFLVCAPDKLCHVRDETIWRSYRFWQDPSKEWATVVTVDDDEIDCHDRGLDLDTPATIAATTCLDTSAPNGTVWPTFVTYDDGVTRWRRRLPFASTAPEYAILLRSWGFRTTDVLVNGQTCATPVDPNDDRLPLRDGSVIEMSSDDDFYVVSNGGTCYRLYRNLMAVLYGNGWPEVIQVPDGSVPSLVTRMDHDDNEFSVTDATTCANGQVVLGPIKNGNETGGGESDGNDLGDGTVASCASSCALGSRRCSGGNPFTCVADTAGCGVWSSGSCNDGFACNDTSGQCERLPPVPPPSDGGTTSSDPPHTLRCTATDGGLVLHITGPILDALVAASASPWQIEYGSDTDGWVVPYASGVKASVLWSGDAVPYSLALPANVGGFNLYVADGSDRSRNSWFDLVDANGDGRRWSVVGDCHLEGTKVVRGAAPTPTDGGASPPSDGGAPPADAGSSSPALTCTDDGSHLHVQVSGITASSFVNASGLADADIVFVSVGGDGGLSWTPSASAQPQAAYASGATALLDLPLAVTRCNVWVWSSKDGRAYWLDSTRATATGTCRISDDGLGGKVLTR